MVTMNDPVKIETLTPEKTPKKFSNREAIRFGWEGMKNHFALFAAAILIQIIVELTPDALNIVLPAERMDIHSFILTVMEAFLLLVGMVITMGLIRISLMIIDGEKPDLAYLFSTVPFLWRYLISTILYILIVAGGLLLLIVPGIYWAIRFGFYGYLIVDRNTRVMESLKKSAEITKGSVWHLFLLGLVLGGIMTAGLLCFGIGIFFTYPTILVATAFVYRKLLGSGGPAIPPPEKPEQTAPLNVPGSIQP